MGKLSHHRLASTTRARPVIPNVLVASGVVLIASLSAQESAEFAPVVPDPSKFERLELTPSRYLDEQVEDYIAIVAKSFNMKDREVDPFGQYQDPEAKPITKPTIRSTSERAAPEALTPFSEIVGKIPVSTVIPGEKQFLVGTRMFGLGDTLPLAFRGRTIRVQITAVTSRGITFKNLETQEIGVRKLDLLPAGMSSGGDVSPPGVFPSDSNRPLILEAPSP